MGFHQKRGQPPAKRQRVGGNLKLNTMEDIFKLLNDKADFHALQANELPVNSTLRAFHNGQAAAYEFSAQQIVRFLKKRTLYENVIDFRERHGGGLGPEDILT
jgi:hypothetical protein